MREAPRYLDAKILNYVHTPEKEYEAQIEIHRAAIVSEHVRERERESERVREREIERDREERKRE